MELGVIDDVESCRAGEWCVSASELVSGLQQSLSAIQGEYSGVLLILVSSPLGAVKG
jgi:hypothetical protein